MKIPSFLQGFLDKTKRWRPLILIVLILGSVIVAGYSIQNNYVNQQAQNRPILILNRDATTTDNNTVATIYFHITNYGVNPAYKIRSLICWVPLPQLINLPHNTSYNFSCNVTYLDAPTSNALHLHQDPITLSFDLARNDSDTWYIYFLSEYRDAENNGTNYTEEYWYFFDFNTQHLSDALPEETQVLRPLIDKFLASYVSPYE